MPKSNQREVRPEGGSGRPGVYGDDYISARRARSGSKAVAELGAGFARRVWEKGPGVGSVKVSFGKGGQFNDFSGDGVIVGQPSRFCSCWIYVRVFPRFGTWRKGWNAALACTFEGPGDTALDIGGNELHVWFWKRCRCEAGLR